MNIDEWISEAARAYAAIGKELTPEKRKHLLQELPATKQDESSETIREAFDVIFRYFFQRASAGQPFGPLERVTRTFGQSIEQRYRLTDGPFIKMAQTYWTYKLEVEDLIPLHTRTSLSHVLFEVEQNIASVFFPTPGPLRMPVDKRRAAQRQLLELYAPSMGIDQFLSESAILKEESARGGCATSAALVVGTVTLALLGYLSVYG